MLLTFCAAVLSRSRKLSSCWKTLGYLSIAFLALCQSSMDANRTESADRFNYSSLDRRKGETMDVDDDPVLTSVAIVHPSSTRWKNKAFTGFDDAGPFGSRVGRTRRDIFHLYNMMTCATHCDPLSYKGYGCYCGFLGSGNAVDFIDSCCRKHDYCYGATPCRHQSLIYFVPYKWKCNGGHPYCVVPHDATKASDHCAHHLCECDRQFAECIRRAPCPAKKTTCPSNPFRSLG